MGQITPPPRSNVTASPSTVSLTVAGIIAVLAGAVGFLTGRLSSSEQAPLPMTSAAVTQAGTLRGAPLDRQIARNVAQREVVPITAQVAVPPPAIMPRLQLTGDGQQATPLVELPEGLCRIELQHNGSSNFAVWLLDSNGKRIELLVNRVGAFSGAKSVRIPTSGRYLFDVSADGPWQIKTSTPTAAGNASRFSGSDQTSTEQFTVAEGLHVFSLVHKGDANFAVWLLDDRGKRVELLVNAVGPFSGSKAVRLQRGNYSLDVSANGPWTIERQSP